MRNNKLSGITLLIFVLLFWRTGISAREALPKQSEDSDVKEFMLDEIRAIGDRSLFTLRREAIKAQELKYEIFNSLNSTDEFDITCDEVASTGSHIKRRLCIAGYMKAALEENARSILLLPGTIRSYHQLAAANIHKTKALNKEMKDLAAKHPELATAMIRENEINKFYEAEHRKRFKNSFLIGHPEPEENGVVLSEFGIWEAAFLDYSSGAMPKDIWERWDNWCKKRLNEKGYRTLWASEKHKKYANAFTSYVNTIISEE